MPAVLAVLAIVLPGCPEEPTETSPPTDQATQPVEGQAKPFRIALVPERDIFAQRRRYEALAGYLSKKIARPVHLVTLNTYLAVLNDFAEDEVDAAFLGSLVAVLTIDRQNGRVLVKPEVEGGVSTYRGVIITPADSPIREIKDLAGRSIAMVKTTTAGDLFPIYLMSQAGLLDGQNEPKVVWVGTHDEVVREVVAGRVDAGALKDLRLQAFEKAHPEIKLRHVAVGPPVPNNGLVVSPNVDQELRAKLSEVLLGMDKEPAGREALQTFGAVRFLPCQVEEYRSICDMISKLGDHWKRLAIEGKPPRIFADCQPVVVQTQPDLPTQPE